MLTQVKPFNQSQGGTTPNLCLANVTRGYGIPNKYASAWEAWEHTQQHAGDAPAGLDVPVYFSYTATIDGINKNWGHIGVRLANGQFWSDGKVYASIQAYTASHSPKYAGWGESVNDVKVIQESEEPVFNEGDRVNVNNALYGYDKGFFKTTVGRPWKDSMYAIFQSDDFKNENAVNDGDVKNIDSVLGGSASSIKGDIWKQATYDYILKNTGGGYTPVTEQLYKKG